MSRTIFIVVAAVAVVAAIGYGFTRRLIDSDSSGKRPLSSRATGAGRAAGGAIPELTSGRGVTIQFSDKPIAMPAMRLTDLDGNVVSNDTLRGKVALVNFWATWCGPCRQEIPMLVALQDRYRDRLLVVGMSIDERPADEVKAFAGEFKVNYPVVMASDGVQQAFGGISAVPSTFVVSPEGKIVQRHLGQLQSARTEHEVRALAGLATEATVETVQDTGQVLLNNAAYATSIPGVDLEGLAPAAKVAVLERLNTEHCTCGCNLTLAQCRINDPSCDVSLPLAQKIAKEARGK